MNDNVNPSSFRNYQNDIAVSTSSSKSHPNGLDYDGEQGSQNMILPGIKIKEKSEFQQGDNCSVCLRKIHMKTHHCRICGKPVCKECSGKRINSERSCDMCFLKKKMSSQESRKKDYLKSKDQTIQRLKIKTQEIESLATKAEIDCSQKQQEFLIDKSRWEQEVIDMETQCRRAAENLKLNHDNVESKKKQIQTDQHILREKEKEGEALRTKISTLKLDISCKKAHLVTQQEKFRGLNQQKDQLLNSYSFKNMEMDHQIKLQRERLQQSEARKSKIELPRSQSLEARQNNSPQSGQVTVNIGLQPVGAQRNRFVSKTDEDMDKIKLSNKKECNIF